MTIFNKEFFRGVWQLTRGYWQSNEKWKSLLLLAVIIVLNLGSVYLLVRLNDWRNTFYNALQDHDWDAFLSQLGVFTILAAFWVIVGVYEVYLRQMLEIRWRRWMTEHYLQQWLKKQKYFLMELTGNSTDNPDQRISEDIKLFVQKTINLSLDLLKATITLISFVVILWQMSGTLPVQIGQNQFMISGYMVWIALIYAGAGTWLAAKIGRPLIGLNFNQQRYEADFRFSLIRLRENSESIAFYGGESQEEVNFINRFRTVVGNYWDIMLRQKKLGWFTFGYNQAAVIFPFIIAAPRYFSNQIQLGGLLQTAEAFGRVQDALSFFVNSYSDLAEWRAVVNRLLGFINTMEVVSKSSEQASLQLQRVSAPDFSVSGLGIALPGGKVLVNNLDFSLNKGESLLITGPTGSGKSTLMRTLAGIWPFGHGKISIPAGDVVLFIPQKSYLPLGALRDVLFYPNKAEAPGDDIEEVMRLCQLDEFITKLDTVDNWSHVLSLGEQQKIAFARAILQRPQWLFLDEATSAMDEPTERSMYELLLQRLPNSTIISVGHRSTLTGYHKRNLSINKSGEWHINTLISKQSPACECPG